MGFGFPYLGLQVELFDAVLEASSGDVNIFEGSVQKEEDVDIVGLCLEDIIDIPFNKSLSV